MKIDVFAMERLQSTYENQVECNLSESGVHPLTLSELVESGADLEALMAQPLAYTQSNGTPELRAAIAALYEGATDEHVLVSNGGSEANFVSLWHLVERDDEVVLMTPNYLQTWGLARAFGGRVREWPLVVGEQAGRRRWRPDLDRLASLVSSRTRLVIICNPNNPTGARVDAAELDEICAIAERHGAWVLSDEIYRGAELDGHETASIWGRYERILITSGLSKAYGLPGLRIGWVVGPPSAVATLWSYRDYTTIAPGALNDRLARLALERERRQRLLARTVGILRRNYPVLRDWLAGYGDAFDHVAPDAGAIAYVRYRFPINSTDLVTRLRDEKSVLVVPGDHFGMDGYLRVGFGPDTASLEQGLARIRDLLAALAPTPLPAP